MNNFLSLTNTGRLDVSMQAWYRRYFMSSKYSWEGILGQSGLLARTTSSDIICRILADYFCMHVERDSTDPYQIAIIGDDQKRMDCDFRPEMCKYMTNFCEKTRRTIIDILGGRMMTGAISITYKGDIPGTMEIFLQNGNITDMPEIQIYRNGLE